MKDFKIISAYTLNTPYEQEVKFLRNSLLKNNVVDFEIIPFKSFGSWSRNCQYKAVLMKDQLIKYKKPIVWLDADAVLNSYPSLFHEIEKDIAACEHYGEVVSGTLYINYNDLMLEFMDEWIKLNDSDHERFDQSCLFEIIQKMKIDIHSLPLSYCKIFDLGAKCEKPVVVHNQASRRFKRGINSAKLLIKQ